jgi:hypothetical protein
MVRMLPQELKERENGAKKRQTEISQKIGLVPSSGLFTHESDFALG